MKNSKEKLQRGNMNKYKRINVLQETAHFSIFSVTTSIFLDMIMWNLMTLSIERKGGHDSENERKRQRGIVIWDIPIW